MDKVLKKLSMNHWNGDQLCAIDVETTGLDHTIHEVIQLSIIPLNIDLEPRRDVTPLDIMIMPDYPECLDPKAMTVNKIKMVDIKLRGFDREYAREMLNKWWEKLNLPYNKFGSRQCRLVPLGHNFSFDKGFLFQWLGEEYFDYFSFRHIDTMMLGAYRNDRAAWRGERVPYSKLTLNWMCNQHGISNEGAHNSLIDCMRTAKLYKALLGSGALL